MDSHLNHHHHHHNQRQQQQQQNMNSGLTRYRSAPSSYFSNLINSGMYEDEDIDPFFNPQVSSPETERILSRLMSVDGGGGDNPSSRHNLGQIRGNNELQFMDSMKQEPAFSSQFQEHQRMMYQNHAQCQEVVHNNINSVVSSSSSSSTMVNNRLMATAPSTNLLRQSSSPAGFFEHINTEDSSISSANRSKRGMAFSSGSHSSSRLLSRIPENDDKTMAHNNGDYVFPGGSWEESAMLTDGFLKEFGESDLINSSEKQSDEGRIHAPTGLTHQLSLPTSSTELSLTEKLLQFHDNVPLRSRAKRGCATHPRSIAERVRRTRISERMKRLQDLVPNMDKQTSTADMLDLAVDYIKQLQNHVETLTDHRKKCTCPRNEEL